MISASYNLKIMAFLFLLSKIMQMQKKIKKQNNPNKQEKKFFFNETGGELKLWTTERVEGAQEEAYRDSPPHCRYLNKPSKYILQTEGHTIQYSSSLQ